MVGYFPPEVDKDAFNCPYCGVYAHQEWYNDVAYGNSYVGMYGKLELGSTSYIGALRVSKCSHCKKIVLWDQGKMLIPRKMTVPDPSDDVPDNVKAIYIEAGKVLRDSPRASGALMRIALELLLQKINNNSLGLNDNVNKLIESKIPEELIKALTILRVNGNDIMHTGEIIIFEKREDVIYLFDLFNMIVDELITRPKKLNEAYNKIPESKRKQIENKK